MGGSSRGGSRAEVVVAEVAVAEVAVGEVAVGEGAVGEVGGPASSEHVASGKSEVVSWQGVEVVSSTRACLLIVDELGAYEDPNPKSNPNPKPNPTLTQTYPNPNPNPSPNPNPNLLIVDELGADEDRVRPHAGLPAWVFTGGGSVALEAAGSIMPSYPLNHAGRWRGRPERRPLPWSAAPPGAARSRQARAVEAEEEPRWGAAEGAL